MSNELLFIRQENGELWHPYGINMSQVRIRNGFQPSGVVIAATNIECRIETPQESTITALNSPTNNVAVTPYYEKLSSPFINHATLTYADMSAGMNEQEILELAALLHRVMMRVKKDCGLT